MEGELKENILLLVGNKTTFLGRKRKEMGYDVENEYCNESFVLRVFRKIFIILNLNMISILFGCWKKKLNKYNTVIIHSSPVIAPIIKYINKKNSNIRVIVWFSNIVSKEYPIEPYKVLNCELWSFDIDDCRKYKMKYNSQFYFSNINLESTKREFDVFFVGLEKGRIEELKKLKGMFDRKNIKSFLYVVGNSKENDFVMDKSISYEEVLKYISKCKVILDINQYGQAGLTMRPLEALFFSKKLITNNKNIMNSKMYNKENVFILGVDDISKIEEFIYSDFKVNEEVKKYYDFSEWINRFFYINKK